MKVVVIGGGMAGLAAATRLAAEGHQLTVVEQKAWLGGRPAMHRDPETGDPLESGPSVFLGDRSRALLGRLGSLHAVEALHRISLVDLEQREPRGKKGPKTFHLKLPHPRAVAGAATHAAGSSAPPHSPSVSSAALRLGGRELPGELLGAVDLLAGIAGFEALSWIERGLVLRVAAAVLTPTRAGRPAEEGENAEAWLERHSQSHNARRTLWRPLALALLHDDPRNASARLLVASLHQAFHGGRDGAPAVARSDFHGAIVDGARRTLIEHGGTLRLDTRAHEVRVERHGDTALARGVDLAGGEHLAADAVIAAVGPAALLDLLPDGVRRDETHFHGIARLRSSPAVTAHLWFERGAQELFPDPRTAFDDRALIGSPFHWLTAAPRAGDGRSTSAGGPGSARVSIGAVAAHDLIERDDEAVLRSALDEAARIFPAVAGARPSRSLIVRDRQGNVAQPAGSDRERPLPRTPVDGLFVAADYVRTGLPATLESACLAAEQAASMALEFEPPPPPPPPKGFVSASTLVRR